jgi:hypothetical protein
VAQEQQIAPTGLRLLLQLFVAVRRAKTDDVKNDRR